MRMLLRSSVGFPCSDEMPFLYGCEGGERACGNGRQVARYHHHDGDARKDEQARCSAGSMSAAARILLDVMILASIRSFLTPRGDSRRFSVSGFKRWLCCCFPHFSRGVYRSRFLSGCIQDTHESAPFGLLPTCGCVVGALRNEWGFDSACRKALALECRLGAS